MIPGNRSDREHTDGHDTSSTEQQDSSTDLVSKVECEDGCSHVGEVEKDRHLVDVSLADGLQEDDRVAGDEAVALSVLETLDAGGYGSAAEVGSSVYV